MSQDKMAYVPTTNLNDQFLEPTLFIIDARTEVRNHLEVEILIFAKILQACDLPGKILFLILRGNPCDNVPNFFSRLTKALNFRWRRLFQYHQSLYQLWISDFAQFFAFQQKSALPTSNQFFCKNLRYL